MTYVNSAVVLVMLIIFSVKVSGNMTCYWCTQQNYHEGCNEGRAVCAGSDVCVTKVERLDSIGKVYTKGCMSSRTCSALEALNDDDLCSRVPSTCFYCCEGALCNQYNTASRIIHVLPVAMGALRVIACALGLG